jgi:serine/threonine-protein kinase
MGEVVLAEHLTLGSHVAVKLLHPEHVMRFELKDRMRIEAQACARVRHDNLVFVLDYGETNDCRSFIVMEFLPGCTVGEEIRRRGALPVLEALDVAAQALAGLGAAHAAGLVHRDVKPDNLFLCEPIEGLRRVKVLDFGIAKIVEAGRDPRTPLPLMQPTAEGTTVGTPRYASPEQSRSERDIDARTDVYSLGWVLYGMLTGREPFLEHRSHAALWRAHEHEMPPLPSSVVACPLGGELDRIVMRAIAKRREDRYPTAEAFRTELLQLAQRLSAPAASAPASNVPMSAQTWKGTAIIDSRSAASLRGGAPLHGSVAGGAAGAPRLAGGTVDLGPGQVSSVPGSPFSPGAKTVDLGGELSTLHSAGTAPSASLVPAGTVDVAGDAATRAALPWERAAYVSATSAPHTARKPGLVWPWVLVALVTVGALAVALARALGLG